MVNTHKPEFRTAVTVIPLILVNIVAVAGQFAFLRQHLSWGIPGDLLFASALESVAIYLAYHAHIALTANDSAFKLRAASYGFGAVIGLMNYSHYAPHWQPTFEAVAVGLMSASSPWLWGVHSRRQSRDRLLTLGLIEPHAVRLGFTRVLWWPIRSMRVFRMAAWSGEREPAAAIQQWESRAADRKAAQSAEAERMTLASAESKADAVRVALRELGETKASTVAAWLAERDWPGISAAYVRQVRAYDARQETAERRTGIHALPEPGLPRALPGGSP